MCEAERTVYRNKIPAWTKGGVQAGPEEPTPKKEQTEPV